MDAVVTTRFTKRYAAVGEIKSAGATYTPRVLADFVVERILANAELPVGKPIRVLDPAVGHGELLDGLLSKLHGDVHVFGFETDPSALEVAKTRLERAHPDATISLREGSFLDHVLDDFDGGLFGSGDGYDLIIANPPYVRTQIIGAERSKKLASQFGLSGRVDLYHAFLLGMARVLKADGTAGFIVSNRFMTTKGGKATRAAMLSDLRLRHVYDFGDTKLFDAAVLPAVLITRGYTAPVIDARFTSIYETKAVPSYTASDPVKAVAYEGNVAVPDGRTFSVQHGVLDHGKELSGTWRLASLEVEAWFDAVSSRTWKTFGEIGSIRVGVKTCADKVFIPKEWDEELELHRPLTTHHIARRFRPEQVKRKILYPHETVSGRRRAVSLERYPRSEAYLIANKEALQSRKYVNDAGREWYEIWVPQNPADWKGPKLVFRDICEQPTFWMDLESTVVNGDCYWLKPQPEMVEVLWLALAVANSTFIEHFYDRRFNNKLYAGRRRFITQYVEQFPLPDPTTSIAQAIIEKSKLIYERVPSKDAELLERELDAMVWTALTGKS